MQRYGFALCAVVAVLAFTGTAAAKGGGLQLDQYKATVAQDKYLDLLDRGLDVVAAKDVTGGRTVIDLVLTPAQVRTLRADGVGLTLRRNADGQSAREAAAAQMSSGFNVWRDYDGPDGFRAYLYQIARENPQLAKVEVIGHSGKGREILALKLTQSAREVRDGSRPAVLYSALQHAREWIAGEVDRRLIEYYIARWRANDKAIKDLLKDNELWFVPVANPDGYQYTFLSAGTRLWRKTLRDNNGNGTTEVGDGVDPNRNWPEHFNYDARAPRACSRATPRGPFAQSETETTALTGPAGPPLRAGRPRRAASGWPSSALIPAGPRRRLSSPRVPRGPCSTETEAPSGLAIGHGPRGRGVFATRRFAKGELVERCPTVELPRSEVTGRLNDYVYSSVNDGDVLVVLGYGMLYNHSENPNLEYTQERPSTIEFLALQTVRPGEELTIDYGDEWWETRGLVPK
jgi:hypothetical protein